MELDTLLNEDCVASVPGLPEKSVHLIISDIPYGIGIDEWDVKHANTNSAYMGTSPAQEKAGKIFQRRGKPLNGWSEADKEIPRQYYDWCCQWTGGWFNVLKPGGNVFVFAGRRFAHRCITAMEDSGFTFKDMLAWDKVVAPYRAQHLSIIYERRKDFASATAWQGWRVGNLRPLFEPILWFTKPYRLGGTIADNVLEYGTGAYDESVLKNYGQASGNIFHIQASSNDQGLHPTQKPLNLMKVLIEMTTKPGQVVLDPFCGSATTLVAALELNRHFLGYENNPEYFAIARRRLEAARARKASMLFQI